MNNSIETTEIIIRNAIDDDAPLLSRLGQQAFRETFTHYRDDALEAFLRDSYSEQRLFEDLRHPEMHLWITEIDGQPAGYAKFGPVSVPDPAPTPNTLELHRLYVLRAWQGQGLGQLLMARALAEAVFCKATRLLLGVWERNLPAQRFYERYGFIKTGEYDYPPIGDVIDREWIMEKRL